MAPGRTERLEEGVRRTRLSSGAEILSERIGGVHSVAVGFWIRQGAAHEPAGREGISHLLEHMVFKGTGRRTPRQIAREVEGVGGTLDAYTGHEHTSFQARVPADSLERALDVLADLVFHPALREQDLTLEREVVLEEIARVEDTPDDLVFDLQAAILYDGHPYGRPILGSRESLEAIDAGVLRELHAKGYRPARLVVAAAGAVEHAALVEAVTRRLPASTGEPRSPVPPPRRTGRGTHRVARAGGRQCHIVAAAPGVSHSDPRRYAAVLVGTALGGGMSSRLFQRIREDRGLAYSVFSFQSFYETAGHVGAYLGTRPRLAERARGELLEVLEELAAYGLEPEELAETRDQLRGELLLSLESPAARMQRLAAGALHGEPYRSVAEVADRIAAIDAAEAAEAAALYAPERLATLSLGPV